MVLQRHLPASHSVNRCRGFTLVEISMVLLLFASAVGGILSFFPVGLKLESNAMSDSAQTMFALDILGQVEANASKIRDWAEWNDDEVFLDIAFKDIETGGKKMVGPSDFKREGDGKEKCWRTEVISKSKILTNRDHMSFIVQLTPVPTPIFFGGNNNLMRRVSIWANDRLGGDPTLNTPFVRDFVFCGDWQANLRNVAE